MQLDAIKLFCDVAQHRSVSKGAVLHGVTQSAASQRLRVVERELGVELIDRSTRPLQLTPVGEIYHRGCIKIMEDYEQLKSQVTGANANNELRGQISVAAIYSSGINLLNRAKKDFEAAHPHCGISVSYFQPQGVYERVIHHQCDMGILSYPKRWRDLNTTPLLDETMILVARPGHSFTTARQIHASQLDGVEMINFDSTLPIGRRIRKHLKTHGATPRIVNEFDNIDTIKSFIRETDAVAILPERTVQREINSGLLDAAVLTPTLVRPVSAVYSRHHEPGPLAKAFTAFLAAQETPTTQIDTPSQMGV